MDRMKGSVEMARSEARGHPRLLFRNLCRTLDHSKWINRHRHVTIVAPMVEGMDKIHAGLGIPCVVSDSSVFPEMMRRVMVVTNRQGLATLTTPVIIVDRKGILRVTVPDWTREAKVELIAATVVETVRVAHKAIIPLISCSVSF